jgi:hypothetical protein
MCTCRALAGWVTGPCDSRPKPSEHGYDGTPPRQTLRSGVCRQSGAGSQAVTVAALIARSAEYSAIAHKAKQLPSISFLCTS